MTSRTVPPAFAEEPIAGIAFRRRFARRPQQNSAKLEVYRENKENKALSW